MSLKTSGILILAIIATGFDLFLFLPQFTFLTNYGVLQWNINTWVLFLFSISFTIATYFFYFKAKGGSKIG